WISHVASSGSELAVQAWWRYRYTGDRQWLRTHAYPLLRGTVEFYRHLVKKEADGRYHLTGTHAHEDFWGVGDSIMDLAAIRGTAPLAIRAAEILDVDAELRGRWQELLANLAPYPMGADPRAKALTGGALADDVWAAGYLGEINGQNNPEDVWLTPVFPFEDWTLETRDAATDAIVQKLLDLAPRHAAVLGGAGLNTAIRTPIAVARAGRGKELPRVLERYYAAFAPLPNGMSLFEGPTAASVEHLGLLTTTLQESLLQSVSPRPGEPEVIHGVAARMGCLLPPVGARRFSCLQRDPEGQGAVRRNRVASRRGVPLAESMGGTLWRQRDQRRRPRIGRRASAVPDSGAQSLPVYPEGVAPSFTRLDGAGINIQFGLQRNSSVPLSYARPNPWQAAVRVRTLCRNIRELAGR
ncbi:MAG: hypothetical protein MUE50_09510, partial [Pirellulaceae bacterium]|nr:hypothetical protein [Pirellulaceae bacterium]